VRLPLLLLAPIAVAYENEMYGTDAGRRSTWRQDRYSPCSRTEAGRYLAFLASLGYQLAPIEQAVVDGEPYTGDTLGDQLAGESADDPGTDEPAGDPRTEGTGADDTSIGTGTQDDQGATDTRTEGGAHVGETSTEADGSAGDGETPADVSGDTASEG
jgi:ParB family chromosome partitioning protein